MTFRSLCGNLIVGGRAHDPQGATGGKKARPEARRHRIRRSLVTTPIPSWNRDVARMPTLVTRTRSPRDTLARAGPIIRLPRTLVTNEYFGLFGGMSTMNAIACAAVTIATTIGTFRHGRSHPVLHKRPYVAMARRARFAATSADRSLAASSRWWLRDRSWR